MSTERDDVAIRHSERSEESLFKNSEFVAMISWASIGTTAC